MAGFANLCIDETHFLTHAQVVLFLVDRYIWVIDRARRKDSSPRVFSPVVDPSDMTLPPTGCPRKTLHQVPSTLKVTSDLWDTKYSLNDGEPHNHRRVLTITYGA